MTSQPLRQVVAELDQIPPGDRYEPGPAIFARLPWAPNAPSLVLLEDAVNGVAPSQPEFAYMLEVNLAREVLEVWSAWRDGARPSIDDAVDAILHYAMHDAYLPVD